MRTVIQRVKKASVRVGESEVSSIGPGLLLLLGIEAADTEEDILWLCHKILGLRIFDDEEGVMNKSIMDVNGEAIVVSQFTLYASYKKGNRPSWKACWNGCFRSGDAGRTHQRRTRNNLHGHEESRIEIREQRLNNREYDHTRSTRACRSVD